MATLTSPPPVKTQFTTGPSSERHLTHARKPHQWPARLILVSALVAGVLLGLAPILTGPAVVPSSAPASAFSAERATHDLQVIAAAPRPIGSPGNAAARAYITDQLTAIGLQPEVQTAVGFGHFPGSSTIPAGLVRNVVVRLHGSASTGAIVLDAHYDGAASGPGAADCGSCVVTVLETMRALKAGPSLRNDVIAVFTDGEEVGDLGAAAFMQTHPWAKDVRLALNFEGWAPGGQTMLYTASANDAALLGEFLGAAPAPVGSSFFRALATLEPASGMDLEEYTWRGRDGLGFFFVNFDHAAYHTVGDNPDAIDPRSIQDNGSIALAAARRFGDMDLTELPHQGDAVYFSVVPGLMLHYPAALRWPFAALVGLMLIGAIALGVRRRRLSVGGIAAAAATYALAVIVTTLLVTLVWAAVKALDTDFQVFLTGHYHAALLVASFVTLAIALQVAYFVLLRKRIGTTNLAAGALSVWAVLMGVSALVADVSFLLTWPLLFAVVALLAELVTAHPTAHPLPRAIMLGVTALPGVILVTSVITGGLFQFADRTEVMSGLPIGAAPVLFVALLLGLLIPQIDALLGWGRHMWLAPVVLGAVGLALLGTAVANSGFDTQHPRPDTIAYVLNADSGQAHWATRDPVIDSWTSQFFPAGAEPQAGAYPFTAQSALAAPAPVLEVPAPELTVVADTLSEGVKDVQFRFASQRGAPFLTVHLESSADITSAALDGQALDVTAAGPHALNVQFSNLPPTGIVVDLEVAGDGPLSVRLTDGSTGLPTIPGLVVQPRSADFMPIPSTGMLGDTTAVSKTYVLDHAEPAAD